MGVIRVSFFLSKKIPSCRNRHQKKIHAEKTMNLSFAGYRILDSIPVNLGQNFKVTAYNLLRQYIFFKGYEYFSPKGLHLALDQ